MGPNGLMVGREDELDFLMGQLARAFYREGGLILISGEAGSGKTTLCEEFVKLALKCDCQVLVGRCVLGAQIPYLPFLEAFFDQTPNPFSTIKDPWDECRGKLLLSVLDGVDRLSKPRTLLLILEDLHWADSASIALVHFLARNVRALKVIILGTVRPEDLHPSPQGEVHPLKESLRIMRREEVFQELLLRPLDPIETKKIVPIRLGGKAEGPLLDLVAKESRGNPLFAVEMIKLLLSGGMVNCKDGIWKLKKDVDITIPPTVREVILARTEHIPKEEKHVLEIASVIGEWFDPDIIEAVLKLDHMELLEELEELENDYQLIREQEGSYKFGHEKIMQVVYEQMSAHRKKEYHRAIGLILEQRLSNDGQFGQLSYHFDRSDDNEICIRYSLAAGKHCSRQKSVREARSYFQLVLKRTEGDQGLIVERLEALEGLGDLRADVSSPREWYSFYSQFLELNKDRKSRARVLAKSAECWDQFTLGDIRKANDILDEAESISDGDPNVLARIEYRRAELNMNDWKHEEALAHIAKAQHYEKVSDHRVDGLGGRGFEVTCLFHRDQFHEAKDLIEELLPLTMKKESPEAMLFLKVFYASVWRMLGELELAKRYGSEVIKLASGLGMTWWRREALLGSALTLELDGDLESAIQRISEVIEDAKEYEIMFTNILAETLLGIFEVQTGRWDSAENHYLQASKNVDDFNIGPRPRIETYLAILKAEILSRNEFAPQSEKLFEDIIQINEGLGRRSILMECHLRYGMFLARRGLQERSMRQFDEAMSVAKKIGCEKYVQIFAKKAGMVS